MTNRKPGRPPRHAEPTQPITPRIPVRLAKALDRLAEQARVSRSEMVCAILEEGVAVREGAEGRTLAAALRRAADVLERL